MSAMPNPDKRFATLIGPEGVLYEKALWTLTFLQEFEDVPSLVQGQFRSPRFVQTCRATFEAEQWHYLDSPLGTDLKVIPYGTTGSVPLDFESVTTIKNRKNQRYYAQMGEYKGHFYGYVRQHRDWVTAAWCTGPDVGDRWEETITPFALADHIEEICKLGIDFSRDRRAVERLSDRVLDFDELPPGPPGELGRYAVPVDWGSEFVIGTRNTQTRHTGVYTKINGQFRGAPPRFLLPLRPYYSGE